MSQDFKELLNQVATSTQLHTANLYILSTINRDDMETFQNVWPTIPTQRRRDIVQELVELVEVNFEVDFDPVFLLALGDEDAEVRTSAINGLWEHKDPALIRPLVHLLKTDPVVIVRATAAIALGKFINMRELEDLNPYRAILAEESLLETIRQATEDVEVRRRAIEAIAYSSETDVTSIIENAYYDQNEKLQVSAIFAMGRNADKKWRPQVIAELDNPNTEIRFEAARACGELEAAEAVPKLVNLIEQDPDLEVQEMAINALGHIGGPVAREVLERQIESDVEALALAADEAMYELNVFSGSFDLFDFDDSEPDDDNDLVESYEIADPHGDDSNYLH